MILKSHYRTLESAQLLTNIVQGAAKAIYKEQNCCPAKQSLRPRLEPHYTIMLMLSRPYITPSMANCTKRSRESTKFHRHRTIQHEENSGKRFCDTVTPQK